MSERSPQNGLPGILPRTVGMFWCIDTSEFGGGLWLKHLDPPGHGPYYRMERVTDDELIDLASVIARHLGTP